VLKVKLAFLAILLTFLLPLWVCSGVEYDDSNVLEDSWNYYKKTFIQDDGRVIDYQKNSITTSEGQAYAMLRAVLANDHGTFKKVYTWSNDNLRRKSDRLYSWLWGKRDDGSWGTIDDNTASDADIDIATALLLAGTQWNEDYYLGEAEYLLPDIWQHETKLINGKRILISGVKQGQNENIEINPSYFSPYAYRLFSKYDSENNWKELIDSSYYYLSESSKLTCINLPPDWFYINSATGKIYIDKENQNSNFSFDAIRTFLRVYIDYKISGDSSARKFLSKADFFIDTWENKKHAPYFTKFKQNGELVDITENTEFLALLLPVVKLYNEQLADRIFGKKIQKYYNKEGFWNDGKNYYLQNLVWLGIWVYIDEKHGKKLFKQALKG